MEFGYNSIKVTFIFERSLNKLNELNDYLNDNAIIDDKIIEHDNYYNIKNSISGIINELNNTVLPSLRYKSF